MEKLTFTDPWQRLAAVYCLWGFKLYSLTGTEKHCWPKENKYKLHSFNHWTAIFGRALFCTVYRLFFLEMTTMMEKMGVSSVNKCITCLYSCNFSACNQSMKVHPAARTVGGKGLLCSFASRFWYRARLLSSGAAQEEDDQLRGTQEGPMTPESTSSVFPPWTNTAGAQSRLPLSRCSCITNKICLQQPAALHTSHRGEGWGNSHCVMHTCKIRQVRLKKTTTLCW